MNDFTKFFEILASKVSRKAIVVVMAMVLLFLLGINPTATMIYFVGGLIAFLALFSVIIVVQRDNDASQPLVDNELISGTYGNLNNTIGSLGGTSATQYNLFSKEKPSPAFGSIVLFTIVSIGKTFGNMIFSIFTLIIKVPLIVLGINQTIIAMIISFLTISVVIALWVVYKFGG